MASNRDVLGGSGPNLPWVDHETWLISIHGTRLQIWSALFTSRYLQSVYSGRVPDEGVVVFSTKEFNLKYDEKIMAHVYSQLTA